MNKEPHGGLFLKERDHRHGCWELSGDYHIGNLPVPTKVREKWIRQRG